MAKFSLKTAVEAAKATKNTESMASGYHRVQVQQVAEIGLQPGFNATDAPKESIGFVFENATGQQIYKSMPLVVNAYSNLNKVLRAVDAPDELEELLGLELVLEIETNGKNSKIIGYHHTDDGLSDESALPKSAKHLYFSVETPDAEVLKQLHFQLRQAVSGRIRTK